MVGNENSDAARAREGCSHMGNHHLARLQKKLAFSQDLLVGQVGKVSKATLGAAKAVEYHEGS